MTKNAYFGPNLAVFGPKILVFMGVSKSFGTNITKNHLDKVNRCLARYSLCTTTTNQPTHRSPNEPARPICAKESIF